MFGLEQKTSAVVKSTLAGTAMDIVAVCMDRANVAAELEEPREWGEAVGTMKMASKMQSTPAEPE